MLKYVLLLMTLNLSLFSMEIPDEVPEKLAGQNKFEDILRHYFDIAKNEMIDELTFYQKDELYKRPINASKPLGSFLPFQQETVHYFPIVHEMFGIEVNQYASFSEKLKKLSKFFEQKGLLTHVGRLHIAKLAEASCWSEQKPLKNLAVNMERQGYFSIVAKDGVQKKFFHDNYLGFLLRNKHESSKITPEFIKFFEPSTEAQKKIGDIVAILKIKQERIEAGQAILNTPMISPKAKIEKIINSELFPEIITNNIKSENKRNNNDIKKSSLLVERLLNIMESSLENIVTQEDVLTENIKPGKIDLVLLYLFYLFDEESKDITSNNKNFIEFNASFADFEDLSIASCLSEFAHRVLEEIGVDLNDLVQEKTLPVVDKNPIQVDKEKKQPNKYNFHHKKRNQIPKKVFGKNQKNKQINKKHKSYAQKNNKKILDEKSSESEIDADETPNLVTNNLATIIDEEIEVSNTINDVDTLPIAALEISPTPQCDHCEHHDEIILSPAEIFPPRVIKGLRNSLSDSNDPKNLTLIRGKFHRALDNFSHLLAVQLAYTDVRAGSLSMALAYDKNRKPILVIATKSNRAHRDSVINALNDQIKYQNERYKAPQDVKSYLREQKQLLSGDLDPSWRVKISHNISKADAWRFLRRTLKDGSFEKDLQSLFVPLLKTDSIIVVDKLFNAHSEISMSDYLLENNLPLGFVVDKFGKKIPYQYIGGNLFNCGKCDLIFRGGQGIKGFNSVAQPRMVFFTQNHYDHSLTHYVVPRCFYTITNQNKYKVYDALRTVADTASLSQKERWESQRPEYDSSDTSDEESSL